MACFDIESASSLKHHRKSDLLVLIDSKGEVRLRNEQKYKSKWKPFQILKIYCLSLAENEYFSVRIVTQPISSISFVPTSRNTLVVAYENTGMVVLLNLKASDGTNTSRTLLFLVCYYFQTKNIIGNLQVPRNLARGKESGPSTIRLIRCHPKLMVAVMVSDDNVVTLWDIK